MEEHGVTLRAFEAGDVAWLVAAHARLYAITDGFDDSFAELVANILADFLQDYDSQRERGWVAERDGVRLGSIFCVRGEDADTAKLRLFLVLPEARGVGLGKQLLRTCMSFAKSRGYTRMVLWTHESHVTACALYKAFGWSLVASKPVRSFGVDLVEQSWEITL